MPTEGHLRTRTTGALALVLLALGAAPAAAQSAPHREKFFIGGGGGGGEVSGNADVSGGMGWLTLGGTVSPKVRLAADFEVLYYPSARGNFFLKGGIGASQVAFTGPGPDGTGFGFGTVLGAGYDWRLGRKISLTPQFTIFGGRTGDIEDDDGIPIANDVEFGVATFSIGVVFH